MNSNDETYNGWANRETWAVALHINNDQGWQESVLEQLRELTTEPDTDDAHYLAYKAGDIIRENVEELFDVEDFEPGEYTERLREVVRTLTDIGSLWRVDWTELGRSFLEDIAEGDDVSSS